MTKIFRFPGKVETITSTVKAILLLILLFFIAPLFLQAQTCAVKGLMGDIVLINDSLYRVNDQVCGGTLVAIDSESITIRRNGEDTVYSIGVIRNKPKPTAKKKKKKSSDSLLSKIKGFFASSKKDTAAESAITGNRLQDYYARSRDYYNRAEAVQTIDLKKALALYKKAEKEAKTATTFLPKLCKDLSSFHKDVLDMHIKCLNKISECEVILFKQKHPDARIVH